MKTHEFLILIASCIFAGVVAIDRVLKDRRIAYRDKINSKTRKDYHDEADQKEWDELLDKIYPRVLVWTTP